MNLLQPLRKIRISLECKGLLRNGPDPVKKIHPYLKLCGSSGNSPLGITDDLLAYIRSILKNESLIPPKVSMEQWSDILFRLKAHWILPFLYWQVAFQPQEYSPPECITKAMRMAFLESRVFCMHMERQLCEILNTFEMKGIRTLVLRGPALAWSVYPDPALRPCSDLDLLVLPEQVVQAREVLVDLGYKCLGRRFEIDRELYREEHFLHQKNPKNSLLVDLHWKPHPYFGYPLEVGMDELFMRARKIRVSSIKCETLHPVDALIHAAIHLTIIHNLDIRLIWINDIALLAGQLRIPDDWRVLQERSVARRARMAVEESLKMAQNWFGLQMPDGFYDISSWPRPTEDELVIWNHALRHNWLFLTTKRFLSDPSKPLKKIRSLFCLIFPHPDIVRFGYPPSREWLLPLSYVRRWKRWFIELIVNNKRF